MDQEQEPVHETQLISVSLPNMATESQFQNAIGGILEPLKRDRATKAEI